MVHGGLRYLQNGDVRLVYEALARAPAAAAQRPPPRAAAPLPDPDLLQGRPHQPQGGPGPGERHVDVRPHRRGPHRQAPPAPVARRDRRPHAHAARRAPGRRLPLLRRRRRRRPAHPGPGAHRRPRPRRRGRQPRRRGRPAPRRRREGRRARRSRPTASASRCGPGPSSTRPGCGATRCAPSTRAATPTASARPRASTSPSRGRRCATTSPWWSRCPRTSAACSSCRGCRPTTAASSSPTSAPPTPTTTGPLDEPQCTADDVAYLLRALNASVEEHLTEADVVGTWAGLRPLVKAASSRSHRRPLAPAPGDRLGRRG